MADIERLRQRFGQLAKGAYLDVLVPRSTDFDPAAVLRDGSPEQLAQAPSRRNLFFDEKAPIHLVLKTPTSDDEVRELLPSLEIVLSAHATDAVPQGGGNAASATGKHDLTTMSIPAGEKAEIMALGDFTYVSWKPTLHLTRPRARLQRPAVYFTANLNVNANALSAGMKPDKDILTPFQALPRNVLDSLNFSPEFRGKHVYLSEDRITKAAPKPSRKEDPIKPVRGASKRAFPTMPALFTRVKYSALSDAVIASLHVETSQVIAATFDVHKVDVDLHGPSTEVDETPGADSAEDGVDPAPRDPRRAIQALTDACLPLRLQAGDETVLLYKIDRVAKSAAEIPSRVIDIDIAATAILDQGSSIELDISFQSQLESKQAGNEPEYRWSATAESLSLEAARSSAQSKSGTPWTHAAPKKASAEAGVAFFFTAPATTNQYDDFLLEVKCINKSSRSRAFVIAPVRQKQSRLTTQQQTSNKEADHIAGIFKAPLLEHLRRPDTFCHTPEVRIGPLAAGASAETAIELRALATDVLNLGTFKIVDMDTKDAVEVKDLPDVVAFEALEGSDEFGSSKFAVKPPPRTLPEAVKRQMDEWEEYLARRQAKD